MQSENAIQVKMDAVLEKLYLVDHLPLYKMQILFNWVADDRHRKVIDDFLINSLRSMQEDQLEVMAGEIGLNNSSKFDAGQ